MISASHRYLGLTVLALSLASLPALAQTAEQAPPPVSTGAGQHQPGFGGGDHAQRHELREEMEQLRKEREEIQTERAKLREREERLHERMEALRAKMGAERGEHRGEEGRQGGEGAQQSGNGAPPPAR